MAMEYSEAHDVLHQLPGMRQARVIRLLADGPTNSTYLVERGGERFVLRLDKAETSRLRLDRDNERTVCVAIAAAGLMPGYTHFDVAAGVCLRPFFAGRSLQREDLLNPRILERLAAVLRRLHRVAPLGGDFDPAASARRYAAQLATRESQLLADAITAVTSEIQRHAVAPAICHNDLVAENMLETEGGGLMLIDWEYAGLGDPFFDLAVVARHHGLEDHLAHGFLETYLQVVPGAAEAKRFALQCRLYDSLLELWNLRVGEQAAGAGKNAARKTPPVDGC